MPFCHHCGEAYPSALPADIEPLISLENAAKLVPCSTAALRQWLNKHWTGPKYYARVKRGSLHWKRRLISIPELRAARAAHVEVVQPSHG